MTRAPSKGGRPRLFNRKKLAKLFKAYIEQTEIPILAEFAARNGLSKKLMYDWPEFSGLISECMTKKEGALESQALRGRVNVPMAIFSLKQMGWSDKLDTTHKGAQPVTIDGALAKT